MKKCIVALLLGVSLICLTACSSVSTSATVEENETESTTETGSDNTSEIEERTWKSDALKEEIVELNRFFRQNILYYSEDESLKELDNTLDVLIENLTPIRNENLMADKFLTELEKTDYESLNDSDKFFFDACIKLLMQEESFEVISASVEDIENITSVCTRTLENGNASPKYDNQIFLKFDERNTEEHIYGDFNLGTKNTYVWIFEDNGSLEIGEADIYDTEGNTFTDEIDGNEYTIVLHMLDTQYYSDIISRNREFFEFIVEYREDVYKIERNAELATLEMRQEEHFEAERKEDEKKNASPQIGMTASEVKQGSWGYPDKVNRDEYSWGVEEQWVYDDKGYVYFEDGVVTAIQHR